MKIVPIKEVIPDVLRLYQGKPMQGTALEILIKNLQHTHKLAQFSGRDDDYAKLGKLVGGAWPTIQHALEELARRRVA